MKIYNSLSRKKEEFIPIEKNKIKMYVCGQTVYDFCHLGHARKAVVFDMIRRWFIVLGYEVLFVENITDIDDKIIKRAIDNNEHFTVLTDRFIKHMHEDFDSLNIIRPDLAPRATHYINKMVEIIHNLIKKGYAYQANNGDVYYSVRNFKNYGELSGKSLDDLQAGERVEIDLAKKDPMDFVLWKSAKENEPYWDSKFGKGRPGWHIECSAMSEEILGKNFDIHGGGQDLQFPHHENEIAQSEAHNGCKFANYWMHNGFLSIDDEKMSKSLGNFFTLRNVLKKYDAEVLRLFILKTHYRSQLNFSFDKLDDAKQNLSKLYVAIKNFVPKQNTISSIYNKELIDWNNSYAKRFKEAMNDDFNTSLAINILFEISTEINRDHNQDLIKLLVFLANSIGLLQRSTIEYQQYDIEEKNISHKDIENFIIQRKKARENKDFNLADKIRKDLFKVGIVLEDSGDKTTWRKQ